MNRRHPSGPDRITHMANSLGPDSIPDAQAKGVGIYAALLVVLMVLINLATEVPWFPGTIVFFAYFVFGFVMNRVVLRGLIEWHPVKNISKLRSLIFWPISYPVLFLKLGIKHL